MKFDKLYRFLFFSCLIFCLAIAFTADSYNYLPHLRKAFRSINDPTDIAGCQLWLDAGQEAYSDDDPVNTWHDQSGNSRDYTAGDAPTFKENIVNSLPIIRFNGSSDYLKKAGFVWTSGPFTVFFVLSETTYTNYPAFMGEYSDNVTHGWFVFASNDSGNHKAAIGKAGVIHSFSDLVVTNTFQILTFRSPGIDGGDIDVDVWRNNDPASATLTLTTISTPANSCIGAAREGTFDRFNGDIAEIIIYNLELTESNRIAVEQYLSKKYDITLE